MSGHSPQLDTLVRDRNVVAIHAHFAEAGMRIARFAKRRKLPLFVTLHGSDVLSVRRDALPARLLNAYLRRGMFAATTVFLAVSEYLRKSALAAGYPEQRLRTQFLGAPLRNGVARTAQVDDSDEPVILFVGRLVDKKGVNYLLKACKRLHDQGCRFKLRIVGDGPQADAYRAEAEPLGATVEFLGFLSPEGVREQLSAAHIFCMPSTQAPNGDNEGLPMVYLEAQWSGLPVVAFNQGPIPEAVVDGVTGILAEDKSADSLATALKTLIDSPGMRADMGVAGRRFVQERFDIRDRSRELDRLYTAAVAGELVS
jgi:glycosyltransferase involved in cell wall biosynthesis